jgi:hypothetical protein
MPAGNQVTRQVPSDEACSSSDCDSHDVRPLLPEAWNISPQKDIEDDAQDVQPAKQADMP